MTRPIRVFDGSFGRLQLIEAVAGGPAQTSPVPQIVVMQDGAIVESGTHAGLVARSQVYAQLHQMQFNA